MHRHRTTKLYLTRLTLLCLRLGAAAIPCSGNASVAVGAPSSDTAYAQPQRAVEIGAGRKLNLYCIGAAVGPSSGAGLATPATAVRVAATRLPTVIFESGLSDWSFTWALVQPRVAQWTRACSYDRAGLGFSDAARRAGTSANAVADLHQLLHRAAIAPPYILVGHSLGGLYIRMYQTLYPTEVAGLVLIDPVLEDSTLRLDQQRSGAETQRLFKQVSAYRRCADQASRQGATTAWQARCIEPDDQRYSGALNVARRTIAQQSSYQRAQLSEALHYANGVSQTQARAAGRGSDNLSKQIPVQILSAPRGDTEETRLWLSLHQAAAARSARGSQSTIANAGHYIQLDAPDQVVEAVRRVLASVQDGEAATLCAVWPVQSTGAPATAHRAESN